MKNLKKTIEAFGTGSSAQEALANAERELNAPSDAEVVKEVVDIQDKKILGLFKSGTVYKARAYYEIEVKGEEKKTQKAPVKKEENKSEKKNPEIKKTSEKAEKVVEEPKLEGVEENGPAEEYIKSILKGLGIESVKVLTSKTDESITFQIVSDEDYGCAIGRRGETLDAIQYLTRLVVNRGDVEYKRVSVNIGNYREKRSQTLRDLAKRNANKVLKYGRPFTFEPMNPFERRVIHTTVQEIENVESYSVGTDDHRRVVIKLVDGVKPTHSSNRGGRRNYSSSSHSEAAKNTTPKSDVSGASLYGKIEPKAKQ